MPCSALLSPERLRCCSWDQEGVPRPEFPFSLREPGLNPPPHRYEYHWADGTNIKKPIKCSAPKYIDYLMTWVQDQLDDETLFPSKIGGCSCVHWDGPSRLCHTLIPACPYLPGVPFPKNFMSVAKTILKRLFRVYAHIYHQHFDSVMRLQEEAHLNTSFKHFIFFVQVSWEGFPLPSWILKDLG